MYFYEYEGVYYTSNKPLKGFNEITQEEYEAKMDELNTIAAEQEKAEKEALLKQLMAELYPGEE